MGEGKPLPYPALEYPSITIKLSLTPLSDVVQRRMGLHWKFIQVVAVHQNPLACIFLSFWGIFARFRAFFCVLVGFCTFLRVFTCFSALGALLGALGTLLGALGTLLGRSWDALGCSWELLGRSWSALGALLSALGTLLGKNTQKSLGESVFRGPTWSPKSTQVGSKIL